MDRLLIEITEPDVFVLTPEDAARGFEVAFDVKTATDKEFEGLPPIGQNFTMNLRMSREKAVELAHVLLKEALRRG
jgi:hypothetical protein